VKTYVNILYSETVKRAYFKRSLAFHPNSNSEKSETDKGFEKFKTLFKVYSILSDEERKRVYDKTGKKFNFMFGFNCIHHQLCNLAS
jgi:DnaJ-class molecular chaperone